MAKEKEKAVVKELSPQQKLFCDEYIISLNAYQAALKAGYAETTARVRSCGWLENVRFQDYINKRLAEKDAKLIATQDEVLKTLTRVLRRIEKESVVVTKKTRRTYTDNNGKRVTEQLEEPTVVEIPTRVSDLNRAAELLGKTHGMYTDKLDLNSNIELDFSGGVPDGD